MLEKNKKNIGKFAKIFILMFLVVFFVVNQQEIKEMFNYKVVYNEFFSQLKADRELKVPGVKLGGEFPYSEKNNLLEIPKLKVEAPIVFEESSSNENLEMALETGVVHYPLSVLPGEDGTTIILGHSAPAGWPKIKYDWIFSRLNELTEEDEIFVHFEHQKYTYYVTKKIFLRKGEEIPQGLTNSENMLILLSCWPPGKDYKRIAVEATLKK